MQATTVYKLFAANAERTREDLAARPQVSREVSHYLEKIEGINTPADLVNDTRLMNFVLRAYGMEDLSYAKALIRKVLEQGPDDSEALANKMSDPRFKELAKDFNFAQFGSTTTTFERTRSGVVEKYLTQSLELQAGEQNDGARLAMYFKRKAADVGTTYSLLGDRALLKFTQTMLGLPEQMSFSTIEKQAEMIEKRLDLEDLKDPKKVEKMVTRFLLLWDATNQAPISVPPLIGTAQPVSLSVDLLTSLQQYKRF